MYNDKMMKLILAPSHNLSAYFKIIEQQEKMAKMISPAMTYSDSIQRIINHHERLSKLTAKYQYPITITDTIQRLINQTERISTSYNKYFEQLNKITKILNPSLAAFTKTNTSLTFSSRGSVSQLDLGLINSFEPIQEDYDAETQNEIDKINDCFENNDDFKAEVIELVNESTTELTTDIYLALAQIIENYVGKINSRAIGLFLNFLITTYCILIPLYQIHLSNQSEERILYRIEKCEEDNQDENNKTKEELIGEIHFFKKELELTESRLNEVINDKLNDSKELLSSLNEKMDFLSKKIVDLEQKINDDTKN
jgi:hypothetical protein